MQNKVAINDEQTVKCHGIQKERCESYRESTERRGRHRQEIVYAGT